MANFKPIYLAQSKLNELPEKSGQLIFTTDVPCTYFDAPSGRIKVEQIRMATEAERKDMLAPVEGLYFITDTCRFWYFSAGKWSDVGVSIEKSNTNGNITVNGEEVQVYRLPQLTKESVGLGNVPNVTTENQTPEYTASTELTALVSGETLAIAFGKLKTSTDKLIEHLGASNPHKITKSHIGLSKVENKNSTEILESLTGEQVATSLGYWPPAQDTTYGIAAPGRPGLVSEGGDVTVNDSTGVMSVVGGTADRLAIARTIALSGDITGQATFNGSANVEISAVLGPVPASKIVGELSIDNIPKGAIEHCVVVTTDEERFALTTKEVQKGDTVKVGTDETAKMYLVIDDTKLNVEEGYEIYRAGSAASVPWTGVTGKPVEFKPEVHTHTKSQITDFPDWAKAETKPTYTKNEVGLSNVENKSAATILSEMTSKNVTDALGFTPIKDQYVHPTYSEKSLGLYKIAVDNIGHVANVAPITKEDIESLGIKVVIPVATDDILGGIKSGGDIAISEDGIVSIQDNSHGHTIENVTGLQDALDAKAPVSHGTHVTYGTATSALVSGATGVVGTSTEVSRADHTHTLPAYPTALKNPHALTINGESYDGSAAKNIEIKAGGGTWDSIEGKPEIMKFFRLYKEEELGSMEVQKIPGSNFIPAYSPIDLSINDLPKGLYSIMMRVQDGTDMGELKITDGSNTIVRKLPSGGSFSTVGLSVDHTSDIMTIQISEAGSSKAGPSTTGMLYIDYILIAPSFTAITALG